MRRNLLFLLAVLLLIAVGGLLGFPHARAGREPASRLTIMGISPAQPNVADVEKRWGPAEKKGGRLSFRYDWPAVHFWCLNLDIAWFCGGDRLEYEGEEIGRAGMSLQSVTAALERRGIRVKDGVVDMPQHRQLELRTDAYDRISDFCFSGNYAVYLTSSPTPGGSAARL